MRITISYKFGDATSARNDIFPVPTSSMWGNVDFATRYADGMWMVSTPSHGGFILSRSRNALVPDYMRRSDCSYEEDCEWAKVALAFPEMFDAGMLVDAKKMLAAYNPDAYEKYFGETLKPGQSYINDQREFRRVHQNDHVAVSAWGSHKDVPAGMVGVFAALGGRLESGHYGADQRYFLVPADEYDKRSQHGFVIDRTRHQECKPLN